MLNLNIGLLGHVDSGKTSLAKVLSEVSSTAAFDKHPQSQERGITIDLGFSSFSIECPLHLAGAGFQTLQFTLVDCPGHASLIKTIIGGAQIIDLMVLVVDATKGIQTQTAECLVIGQITGRKMVVALNKTDLLDDQSLEKMKKKMRLTMDKTPFKNCTIVPTSALTNNTAELLQALSKEAFIPGRHQNADFLFAVDHCFGIKGKGTVLTGTVLQGQVKINDEIEIPVIKQTKKVKSIQTFRKPVEFATAGDRAGICVTQFDPKTVERGIAATPGYITQIQTAITTLNRVQFFKAPIASKAKFHVNVGYENVIAKITLFEDLNAAETDTSDSFDFKKEYRFVEEISESSVLDHATYVLLEFERVILAAPSSPLIAAKLDADVHANSCRLAFFGRLLVTSPGQKSQTDAFLTRLLVYKEKCRRGVVERLVNPCEVVGRGMFKKETDLRVFQGLKVVLGDGEKGVVEGAFGQSGKFKVRIPEGLKESTIKKLDRKNENQTDRQTVEIILYHKRFIFDPDKKMVQS